jgi:pyrimidine deaminase RibD-like protein/SAM-dependent methyltransferase
MKWEVVHLIPADKARELMALAVDEAKKSIVEDKGVHPYVGAVIAAGDGEIIATAYRGETGPGRHAEFNVLSKAEEMQVDLAKAELFVTLEPCTARGPGKIPCAQRIADSGIGRVHIGMLDPNPQILGRGETDLRWNGIDVERFPSDMIRELEQLNAEFIRAHREAHLPNTSLYVSTQICDIILQELQRHGLEIKELPYDWDVSIEDLIHYCRSFYSESISWTLEDMVHRIRGLAFDKKYADYTYTQDARGLIPAWQDDFHSVLTHSGLGAIKDYRVMNVGIGNGLEGRGLLDEIAELTLVDVAPRSLEAAKAKLPRARAFVADAEKLVPIRTSSQDVYMSLRTYQSSYFDVIAGVREAYRVLRPGGLFVASVANAFVGEEDALVPGLVIPHTSIVDRDRPFEVAEKIRRQLTIMRFENVGIHSGLIEIYVFGRRTV